MQMLSRKAACVLLNQSVTPSSAFGSADAKALFVWDLTFFFFFLVFFPFIYLHFNDLVSLTYLLKYV